MKRSILQKIARHVLKSEILELLKSMREIIYRYIDYKNLYITEEKKKEHWRKMYREAIYSNATIPDFFLYALLKHMPNANEYANNPLSAKERMHHGLVIDEITNEGSVKFRYCGANSSGIYVEFCDIKLKLFIPIRRQQIKYNMLGFDTEIDVWVWDFKEVGFSVISAEDYKKIKMFVEGQYLALTDC